MPLSAWTNKSWDDDDRRLDAMQEATGLAYDELPVYDKYV